MKNILYTVLLSLYSAVGFAQAGANDNWFIMGNGFNSSVFAVAVQPNDDKIIAAGWFTDYDNTTANNIIRLNANGTIDNTFSSGAGISGSGARILKIQDDGKILVAGYFQTYNNVSVGPLIRLNSDGTLDNTFQITCNDQINTLSIQSDGKIIVGGWFTEFNGTAVNRIVRLNTDGSTDNTFNVGTGAEGEEAQVLASAVQSDDKILIGGIFTTYNGTSIRNFARLNSDGSIDQSFNTGTGPDYAVRAMQIQPDNKIVIGGTFYNYNNVSNERLTRVNADGTIDAAFNLSGSGFNSEVYDIAIQNDGKIIATGYFTEYNGTPAGRIVRLNSNGTLDHNFNATGANAVIYSCALQSNQQPVVAGDFVTFDGESKNYITRLNNCIGNSYTISGTLQVCFGESAALSVESDAGDYSWYDAAINGTYLAGGADFTTAPLTETTTFYVQDSLACGVITSPVTVTVQAVDNSVTQQGATLSAGNPNIEATYQWYNCTTQQIIANETNSSFTATENGSYALIVTQLLCTDTSTCFSVTGIGIDTHELNGTFSITPNPATENITLRYSLLADAELTIEVLDVSGRLIQSVATNKAVFAGDVNTQTISVAEYSAGFYFIGITASNGEQIMHKLIVAR
ncbi:MAG: T9SS type A sorting domain-containing protein [Bacteroidia bacterium]